MGIYGFAIPEKYIGYSDLGDSCSNTSLNLMTWYHMQNDGKDA